MGVSLSSVYMVQGFGLAGGYEIEEFDIPFLFSDEAAAVEYADKLKRVADKLAGFYIGKIYEANWGDVELTNEEYKLFEKRAEYWDIRSNKVWVREYKVR